jgi:hypothetical protein
VSRQRVLTAFIALAWLGVILLRLPYLFGPQYLLDGDEAVLGLMAWHTAQGRELPVLFWGQSYGLSLLEVVPASLIFRVAGPVPIVLPLTMLMLYLAALPFYARAFERLSGSAAWSRLLCLAMAVQPVWIIWSLKARGGYMTAFALFGVLLWLLVRGPLSWRGWLGVGLVQGLLFLAQPLWLVMSLPLLGLGVRTDPPANRVRAWLAPLVALAAAALSTLLMRVAFAPTHPSWNPRVFEGFELARLISFPIELYRMFTGFFYLRWIQPAPAPVAAAALLAALLFFAGLAGLLLEFVRTRKRSALVVALALLLTILPTVLLQTQVPRYLLQSSVLLFVALAAWIGIRGIHFTGHLRFAALLAVAAIGLASLNMRSLRYHPTAVTDAETDLLGLIRTLQSNDVKGVYSVSGLLHWQILFYGQEEIPARFIYLDRRPEYLADVNAARGTGARTALVGTIPGTGATDLLNSQFRDRVVRVGERFFVVYDPPDAMLQAFGFEQLQP